MPASWTHTLIFPLFCYSLLCPVKEIEGDVAISTSALFEHFDTRLLCLPLITLSYSTTHSCTPTHSFCFSYPQLHLLLFHLTSPRAELQRRWRNVEMLDQVSEFIPPTASLLPPAVLHHRPSSPLPTKYHSYERCFLCNFLTQRLLTHVVLN